MQAKHAKKAEFGTKDSYYGEPKEVLGCPYADVYQAYPNAQLVSNPLQEQREAADLFTHTIASSLSPFPAIPTAQEDFRIFSCAVRDVIEAVRDHIITQAEADAVIEALSRQLATRRVDAAFFQAAVTRKPDFPLLVGIK